MADVTIDPDDRTVTATRSLRSAGASLTLTVPPQILQVLRAGEGDDIQLTAHMDSAELVCTKVPANDTESTTE